MLLAAGAGRRFGGPKAVADLGGELLVERGLRLLVAGGCDPRFVVLGADAERVRSTADLDGGNILVVTDWSTGMAASLRAGLAAALDGDAAAVVVALVDQPWIESESIARLRRAWQSGADAAVATYAGTSGHPVLFTAAVVPEVMATLRGDHGARGWLHANRHRVTAIDCTDVGNPADVDSPADLTGR